MAEERPRRKWLRYGAVFLALLLVIGGLAAVKFKQIKQLIGFGEQMQAMGPPPEAIGSSVAEAASSEK